MGPGVGDDLRTDLLSAEDEVANPLGNAGVEQALEQPCRDERRRRGGLPDDTVARRERRREVLARNPDRVVPRRDDGHDAMRLADREHALARVGRRQHARLQRADVARGVAIEAGGELDLAECLAQRLALLERQRPCELLATCVDPLPDRLAQPRPFLDAESAHSLTSAAGGLDCPPSVLTSGIRHERQHLAGCRARALERLAARRLDPGPSDVQAQLDGLAHLGGHPYLLRPSVSSYILHGFCAAV